jgi:anti-sigma B factor antagonist
MEITVSTEQGRVLATILQLRGDLDAHSEPAVVQRARELIGQGAQHVVIDLTEVGYVSSAGVRALHAIYLMLRPAGDEAAVLQGLRDGTYHSPNLKLMSPKPSVHSVLATTGIDMVLEIHPDLASAVGAF